MTSVVGGRCSTRSVNCVINYRELFPSLASARPSNRRRPISTLFDRRSQRRMKKKKKRNIKKWWLPNCLVSSLSLSNLGGIINCNLSPGQLKLSSSSSFVSNRPSNGNLRRVINNSGSLLLFFCFRCSCHTKR